MHTNTYLKAALHQLSLAKAETKDLGHQEFSESIAAAEGMIIALVKESYTVGAMMGDGTAIS